MTPHLTRKSGRLTLGGVDLGTLCARHGTPLFAYDAERIRHNARRLLDSLPESVGVHYSVKANPTVAIVALLRSCGLGAEIASDGELASSLAAGYSGTDIVFAGPGKTDEELSAAIDAGVACINCESAAEVARVGAIARDRGVTQDIALRINPGASASNGRIPTGGGPQKFGIDESQAPEAIDAAQRTEGVRLTGYHVSTASQVHDASLMLKEHAGVLAMLARLSEQTGFRPESINLGGGIGVAHTDDDPVFDIGAYGQGLGDLLDGTLGDGPLAGARVLIEPGRALVSDAGVYLTRVLDVKISAAVTHAITDGGINHALLPITANRYRAQIVVERDDANDAAHEPVVVGGPLCTSADQWRSSVPLPGARPGDVIALLNSGAYGLTAGMTLFLSRATPAEVLIDAGEAHLIRRRSTSADLLATQTLPERAPAQQERTR